MRANQAFPSTYLKSSDAKDRPIITTIKAVEREEVGNEKKEKWVLYFEDQKPMVLNRTNWDAIEEAFGELRRLAGS